MRLVRGPARSLAVKGLGGMIAVALATGLVAFIAFPAGGGEPQQPYDDAAFLPGNPRAGAGALSQVPSADCTQWRDGDLAQRLNAVSELGDHFGHETEFWVGVKLPDGEAYEVLDDACDADWARKIKLYKVYARALAFRGLVEQG